MSVYIYHIKNVLNKCGGSGGIDRWYGCLLDVEIVDPPDHACGPDCLCWSLETIIEV